MNATDLEDLGVSHQESHSLRLLDVRLCYTLLAIKMGTVIICEAGFRLHGARRFLSCEVAFGK